MVTGRAKQYGVRRRKQRRRTGESGVKLRFSSLRSLSYPLDDIHGDGAPEVSRQALERVFYDELTPLGHVSLQDMRSGV